MTYHYAADICSAALVRLGEKPIASLDEPTDKARLCKAVYPVARDALLRDHPWSCARRRARLEAAVGDGTESGDGDTPPAFGFAHRHPLPADFLRLLAVDAPGGLGAGAGAFALEGRAVLANATPLTLLYIAGGDAADETQWDAAFRHALTLALAAELAYPVTQSAALADRFAGQLQDVLRRARATNGAEQPSGEVRVDSPLLAVHGGGGAGGGGAGEWWQRSWWLRPEPK